MPTAFMVILSLTGTYNILVPVLKLRFHLHSFIQWLLKAFLQWLWPCPKFPVLIALEEQDNSHPCPQFQDISAYKGNSMWTTLSNPASRLVKSVTALDHRCNGLGVLTLGKHSSRLLVWVGNAVRYIFSLDSAISSEFAFSKDRTVVERGITLTLPFLLSLSRAHTFSWMAPVSLAVMDAITSLYLWLSSWPYSFLTKLNTFHIILLYSISI